MTSTTLPLFAPGTLINARYELRCMINRGGMGEVYHAYDRILNRELALKVMLPGMDDVRFLHEARAQAGFTHDALMPVWDVSIEASTGTPFFTMPLMKGALVDVVSPPLAAADVLHWLTPVAEGLDYLHGRGLVHRDLKPANILVAPDNKIKIADFGLIKDLSKGLTASLVGGTPRFMAPEQLQAKHITPATDVYALGMMAYLLLTAQFPYKTEVDCLTKTPKTLRHWIASIPSAVEAVVLKAIARQPANRYPSAGAFVADLGAALAPAPVVAAPVVAAPPPAPAGGVAVVVATDTAIAKAVKVFLDQVEAELKRGHATEHTYRPHLKDLLEACADDLVATNEPKRIKAGAPDFWLTISDLPVGHVEAKDVGSDLAKMIAESEKATPRSREGKQFARYRVALPRLLVTDCLEWYWFDAGAIHPSTPIRLATWNGSKLVRSPSAADDFTRMIRAFLLHAYPSVSTPAELAARMAELARLLYETILEAFATGDPKDNAYLFAQRDALREQLLPGLSDMDFADHYAQTLAYGLFAARVAALHTPGLASAPFTLQQAAFLIPHTIPFLRRFFSEIAGPDLDDRVVWIVEDLVRLLDATNIAAVMHGFGAATKTTDVVIHFYERFLDAYNPQLRKERGVYYTPDAVISYLVRSVDLLLQTDFQYEEGLLSDHVTILDPATGTGTFLLALIYHIHTAISPMLGGAWPEYAQEKVLPRLYGFEVLIAPYTIAHLRLTTALRDMGCVLPAKERLGIYLTNTLADAPSITTPMAGFGMELTRESQAAYAVKETQPVLVVLGNPPYSGHSQNTSDWISTKIDDYKKVDGAGLGERNPKWLQNDYVKFIRFAQWRIEQTGHGIVAYITDNSYLDGPTFRGMRQSLLTSFDSIYILNLHGNSKRKERTPSGGTDENVFNIQQGVALLLMVRKPGDHERQARVQYADLWGEREGKYHVLEDTDVTTTAWETLTPRSPMYLFVPQDTTLSVEYERGWKVSDIFPVNSVGIVTGQDALTVAFNREAAEILATKHHLPVTVLSPIAYRPFDQRFITYHKDVVTRMRFSVMQHIQNPPNIAIHICRQVISLTWEHIFVTEKITDDCYVSNKTRERGYMLPLYTYPTEQEIASGLYPAGHREANLNPEFVAAFAEATGLVAVSDGRGDGVATFGPEDIFHYIYAILHSPSYRSRYAGFLKADFPRVPLPVSSSIFWALAAKGAELVDLHLLRGSSAKGVGGNGGSNVFSTSRVGVSYPASGNNTVERVRYDPPSAANSHTGRVYINTDQYFTGVAPEVWSMQVGGYRPIQKWLDDRKGRTLSIDDIRHYSRIIAALRETQRVMTEIDALVPEWPLDA